MSEESVSNWIKLSCYPNPDWIASQFIKINRNEFVRFSNIDNGAYGDKYNIIKEKWEKLILPFPTNIKLFHVVAAFDEKMKILYIYTKGYIIEMNMKTNKITIYDNIKNLGHSAKAIVIDHKFNIFGGCANTKHFIWNNHKLEQQYDFTQNDRVHCNYFVRFEIVHFASKNILFCIGGYDGMDDMDSIFSYNTMDKKWSKLKMSLPREISEFGCVASRDQRYIILFGGGSIDSIDINVWDITNMIFNKSSIVCPIKGFIQAINMNDPEIDELLTFGFIRGLWRYPEFSNILYPPFYLIKMVGTYYSNEWIYIIEQQHGDHWKIKLDTILEHVTTL